MVFLTASCVQLVLSGAVKHDAAQSLTYLHSAKSSNRVKHVTHWVVAGLAHQRGRSLAAAAVNFLADPEDEFEPAASRIALLLAPAKGPSMLDIAVASALKVRGTVAVLLCALRPHGAAGGAA